MRRIIIAAMLMVLASPSVAQAFVVCVEYAGARARVPNPGAFEAVIGYPGQCIAGKPCWLYTKGTRSPVASYPESWYLHAAGRRVHDRQRPRLFVMNPLSGGWRQHVAQACAKLCFLDGMGPSGIDRATPRPAISYAEWEAQLAGIVRAVVAAGKQAMPNSMGEPVSAPILRASGGLGSTESFSAANAQRRLSLGRIWVTERGGCAAKYAAYLRYAGAGDHFGCFNPPARPWDLSWRR